MKKRLMLKWLLIVGLGILLIKLSIPVIMKFTLVILVMITFDALDVVELLKVGSKKKVFERQWMELETMLAGNVDVSLPVIEAIEELIRVNALSRQVLSTLHEEGDKNIKSVVAINEKLSDTHHILEENTAIIQDTLQGICKMTKCNEETLDHFLSITHESGSINHELLEVSRLVHTMTEKNNVAYQNQVKTTEAIE